MSFSQITEAYLSLRKEGQSISIEQFADAVPAFRDEILAKLPVMVLLDDTLGHKREEEQTSIARGTVIEGCRIEHEIGRGAVAVVFRADQIDFDRKVAVKVVNKNRNSEWHLRFGIERRAMARLDHPNIVPPYSFVEHDEFDCLIMKYIDGYSLEQLINEEGDYKGRIIASRLSSDWDQFATIAADAADAVAHAHAQGIIHRDIKPSNLMIDGDMKVWITDFGLTKIVGDRGGLSRTGDAIGTPRFMAPEQLRGVCDERSDIYSLGLTLHVLACGKPLDEIGIGEARSADLRELNPAVPPDLARVIMKACDFDPDERYQTAEELRIVLDRYLAGRVPDRRHRNRNHRRFFVRNLNQKLAAAAVIGVCSLGGWHAWSNQKDPNQDKVAVNDPTRAVNPTGDTLLDGLVDRGPTGVDVVVTDVVRQHIDKSASSLNLSVSEANVLQSRVESLIADKNVEQKTIEQLVDDYRQSALLEATRLLRLTRVIERSGLPNHEKQKGIESVRRAAFLVAKKQIDRTEATSLEQYLTFNQSMTSQELNTSNFSDQRIRSWLQKINDRLVGEQEVDSVSEEIEAFFDKVSSERASEST